MLDVLARQLEALRAGIGNLQAQADAMAAVLIEAARQANPSPAPEACAHPHTEDDGSTLDCERLRCLQCGERLVRPAVHP